MIKKNAFIIALLIIYILFLAKDHILGFVDNTSNLTSRVFNDKLDYYKKEYESMQELLNIPYADYPVIYSRVILRDIYAFYDEIVIGKGSSDGVKKQDLVINELGVIGIVKDVNKHSSIVELLTNSDLELSVKINNSYGILGSSDKEIIVKNIKLDQEITVGDDVYTSGLTKIPGDIYIGKVKEIKKDNLELEYIIKVDAINYLEDITYVAVIGEAK